MIDSGQFNDKTIHKTENMYIGHKCPCYVTLKIVKVCKVQKATA